MLKTDDLNLRSKNLSSFAEKLKLEGEDEGIKGGFGV